MLEVRIPISPTPAFINRVRLIATSIREWYPDTVVTVSCHPAPEKLWPERDFIGISVPSNADVLRWKGTRAEYSATIFDRFRPPYHGDYVLMLDADVLPVQPFNELFLCNKIQGVVTHVPPWGPNQWHALFTSFGLPPPQLAHLHTGSGIMVSGSYAPRGYYNSGMLFGPRTLFEQLAEPLLEAIEHFRHVATDWYWVDQVSTCLAINSADIPTQDLPITWNFPNRTSFDKAYPEELADVRFVHAMDTSDIHRDRHFKDDHAIAKLCKRTDLTGSNLALQRRVRKLTDAER